MESKFKVGNQVVTEDSSELRDIGIPNLEATVVEVRGAESAFYYKIWINCQCIDGRDGCEEESNNFTVKESEIKLIT